MGVCERESAVCVCLCVCVCVTESKREKVAVENKSFYSE